MSDSKTRGNRLTVISNILSSNSIASQEELIKELRAKGYTITQATLSRDLKALGVVKVPHGDSYRYHIHSSQSHKGGRNPAPVVSVDATGNLVVIKSGPGFAAAIASTIDNNVVDPNIMGTIAGDDTVLLIMRDAGKFRNTMENMAKVLPEITDLINK